MSTGWLCLPSSPRACRLHPAVLQKPLCRVSGSAQHHVAETAPSQVPSRIKHQPCRSPSSVTHTSGSAWPPSTKGHSNCIAPLLHSAVYYCFIFPYPVSFLFHFVPHLPPTPPFFFLFLSHQTCLKFCSEINRETSSQKLSYPTGLLWGLPCSGGPAGRGPPLTHPVFSAPCAVRGSLAFPPQVCFFPLLPGSVHTPVLSRATPS